MNMKLILVLKYKETFYKNGYMIKLILDKNYKYYTIIYIIFQYLDKNILTAFKLHYKIPRYHIEFERIHPFEDGNGRTGRLLINYELLKNNLPPVVISKKDRVKYFEFLRNNDGTGLAEWLKELSNTEKERMKKFGYKN